VADVRREMRDIGATPLSTSLRMQAASYLPPSARGVGEPINRRLL
jgi:hypothetical protein